MSSTDFRCRSGTKQSSAACPTGKRTSNFSFCGRFNRFRIAGPQFNGVVTWTNIINGLVLINVQISKFLSQLQFNVNLLHIANTKYRNFSPMNLIQRFVKHIKEFQLQLIRKFHCNNSAFSSHLIECLQMLWRKYKIMKKKVWHI